MLKIAFCDDETQETRRLEALLEEYAADRGQDFAHTSYQSPVELMGRTLTFHLNNGVVLESMGRLDDLCDQLVEYPNFLRPHRSFLINMEYIANIAARSITMQDGAVVPLPHGKYSETKDRYLSYIFDRKQVVM